MRSEKMEQEFVQLFVKKSRQERILWEIGSKKYQDHVIAARFHDTENFQIAYLRPLDYHLLDQLYALLHPYCADDKIYYMGGRCIALLPLDSACDYAERGDICILYCGNGVGYYQGEQSYGPPPRYLLWRRK